ncbi:CDP-alcohol phosphatidyltransferase family protein [uncultured Roseobacter sp.]|uniref:CDP-alcohol phosphatidyltransferase family protein n=1 Tax=uncultured Roseobacter sp. TaxID=114847 RepID=UPI00262C7AA6|nr:CDP-alcohol phosphatidyltransferase family protein [uncultured Roseobacter sp.]
MINSDPQQVWQNDRATRPSIAFIVLAFVLLIAVAFGAAALFDSIGVPVAMFVVISATALRGLILTYPHSVLGSCNSVTLARAAMISVLAGAVLEPGSAPWIVFVIASVAFAMDGLDGWLARRSGLSSAFGARFDMETDAVLGALLALILLSSGRAGPEVLVLGFTRYVFVAASIVIPKLGGALPESFRRKAVCVVQIAALIILLCPLTPASLLWPISVSAALLLLWSFAIDIRWLFRERK